MERIDPTMLYWMTSFLAPKSSPAPVVQACPGLGWAAPAPSAAAGRSLLCRAAPSLAIRGVPHAASSQALNSFALSQISLTLTKFI
ncbi:hypothetical protein BDA96_03G282300 [Sorghum bicolor]|uniref:Uncharacterized protein n=2 Tax=Sorghum bicolor TaxID=4558 RepID=A0A921RF49_SORBI|nr:hypothetical protein BDA96_03G282300 [Sorghum bicolor]KXG33142.1 hypothetical protein SORBI_3003G260500 [Sorghum bicolor]